MDMQRIFVSVVGFTDVERHALNTVFRLSEERSPSYGLWPPLMSPGSATVLAHAQVALVDGECAEAVLFQARALPQGQRLIWVGANAPDHAWRVVDRPIHWASLLDDLDAVFAAYQIDSGLLDLDITEPGCLEAEDGGNRALRRALLVGSSREECFYLRSRLALVGVVDIDEANSNESALMFMGRYDYCCGVFNLDDLQIDAWSLARVFAERFPRALTMGSSELAGPLAAWWRRRRVRRDTRRAGIRALISRPLQPPELSRWMDLLAGSPQEATLATHGRD
jgi:hypothetical protein